MSRFPLVEVRNPNPRAVFVYQGTVLVAVLRPHDKVLVPLLDQTRLTSDRRSLVVCSIPEMDEDEWVQEVTSTPVRPDPEKRIVDVKTKPRKVSA